MVCGMKWLTKPRAAVGVAAINAFIIVIRLLVIVRVLPYNLMGGGRLMSYEAAATMSVITIMVLLFVTLLALAAGGIIRLNGYRNALRVFLLAFFVFFCFHVLLGFVSTMWLERYIISTANLVVALLVLRLAHRDKEDEL